MIVGLLDGLPRRVDWDVVAVSDEDVAVVRICGVSVENQALDERVRIAFQDAFIVEGAGVALFAVAQDVLFRRLARCEETPFDRRRKCRAAAAAEAGRLDLVDNLRWRHFEQRHV